MTSCKLSALAGALAIAALSPLLNINAGAQAADDTVSRAAHYAPPHNAVTDQQYWCEYTPAVERPRMVQFLGGVSLGDLEICPAPPVSALLGKKMPARGKITVPARWTSTFTPGKYFYLHPEIAALINPVGIDRINLVASSLDDSEDGLCDKTLAKITCFKSIVEVSLNKSDATDSGAKFLTQLPDLQHITAVRGCLEGACLKDWVALKKLHSLRLDNCPLGRANFQYFAAMPCLEYLGLERCFIKDAEMKHLGNCKHLIALTLCDNFYINDGNIAYLKNCKNLRFLNLTNTSVTGVGLLKLAGLKLQIIYVPDAKCTEAQRLALNKAFPGTYFAFNRVNAVKRVDHDDKVIFGPLH